MKKKMEKFRGESPDFMGAELEDAYSKAFGGQVEGGFSDHGKDVFIPEMEPRLQHVQVKSSLAMAKEFLSGSIKRANFIPICIGQPGAKEEMILSLRQFGGWVGHEIPDREQILKHIAEVKNLCYSKKRQRRAEAQAA